MLKYRIYRSVSITDHEVDNTAEDDRGDGAQTDVRQDLRQEVDRHSVVAADVLVPVTGRAKQKPLIYGELSTQRSQLCQCPS